MTTKLTEPVPQEAPPIPVDVTREQIIDQLMEGKGDSLEPGGSRSVVHQGDAEMPLPLVQVVESAGHVILYDTESFEPSLFNKNMVPGIMRLKRPDGKYQWTQTCPGLPQRGSMKCLLHPDQPEREQYTRMGLGVCRKRNIPTQFQLTQHMKTFHPGAFATLEDERQRREREEDRKLQRDLIKAATTREKRTRAK